MNWDFSLICIVFGMREQFYTGKRASQIYNKEEIVNKDTEKNEQQQRGTSKVENKMEKAAKKIDSLKRYRRHLQFFENWRYS